MKPQQAHPSRSEMHARAAARGCGVAVAVIAVVLGGWAYLVWLFTL